jgi:hypothetical protein
MLLMSNTREMQFHIFLMIFPGLKTPLSNLLFLSHLPLLFQENSHLWHLNPLLSSQLLLSGLYLLFKLHENFHL